MSAPPIAAPPRARRTPLLIAAALLAALAGGVGYFVGSRPPAGAESKPPEAAKGESGVINFPPDEWGSVGLTVEPAVSGVLADTAWRPARIALDEEKTAHLAAPVEGIVREVNVRIGQRVEAGAVLAVVEAKAAGVARLEVARAKVAAEAEAERLKWATSTAANVESLLKALEGGPEPAAVEQRFAGKLLGDWRDKLISAYSNTRRAKAAQEAADAAGVNTLPAARVRQLRGEADTAGAAYVAVTEEARFQTRQAERQAELKSREVAAARAAARARLIALGVPADSVDMPVPPDQASRFPVITPVAGYVLMRNAVVGERAAPETMLFEVSDLTTVWVRGDVFEPDFGLTTDLEGKSVPFRIAGQTTLAGRATVIDAGATVDPKTHAADLIASTPNPDRSLKPGQFAELGLPRPAGGPVVHVPLSAIHTNSGRSYAFVQTGSGAFKATPVMVGRTTSDRAEIKSGLTAGTPVAASGSFVLKSEWLKDTIQGE